MKRLSRKLAVAVAVLVWLGALVYLLVLSRRKLPELGTGAGGGGGGGGGGEAPNNQISDAEWEDMLEGFDERSYLSARRWRPGDDPYTLYAFNQRESERIPSNRALRDTRHYSHFRPTQCGKRLDQRAAEQREVGGQRFKSPDGLENCEPGGVKDLLIVRGPSSKALHSHLGQWSSSLLASAAAEDKTMFSINIP
uniref:polypeptide N-acetylgalactosaminyltransferase 14-like n=1 Tax=Centroberyx gerrardi TaxID=166262 RepID=UPI003AACFB3E